MFSDMIILTDDAILSLTDNMDIAEQMSTKSQVDSTLAVLFCAVEGIEGMIEEDLVYVHALKCSILKCGIMNYEQSTAKSFFVWCVLYMYTN